MATMSENLTAIQTAIQNLLQIARIIENYVAGQVDLGGGQTAVLDETKKNALKNACKPFKTTAKELINNLDFGEE